MPPHAVVTVLGDELLHEIFARLPTPASLISAVLACKAFLRAARDGPFLRRFRALHPAPPFLLGFLFFAPDAISQPVFLATDTTTAPRPRGDLSFSFLPGVGCWPWPAAGWALLDARDGHFLLQNRFSKELAVADPLARTAYLTLPPPPCADDARGYGLVVDHDDNWAFRVACVARDPRSPGTLRALVLSSADDRWVEVGALPCRGAGLAADARVMHAGGSLYWRLADGRGMVALDDAGPGAAMSLSVMRLPPSFAELASLDVVDSGEQGGAGHGLYVLAMRDYCVEHWVAVTDGASRTWTMLDKSVRLFRALEGMLGAEALLKQAPAIVGVVEGVAYLRQGGCLLSVDLVTMKLTRLSEEDCSDAEALIYPYVRPKIWLPRFLNPPVQ